MTDAELFEDIRSYTARKVAEGFAPDDEIVQTACEIFEDESGRSDLRPHIERLVAESAREHRDEEMRWDTPTDCDRLDAAFAELEARGIVARQDFACCTNCGRAEIVDEIQAAREAGRAIGGYAFYHMQDTESALDGGSLRLAYGSTEAGREAMMIVGEAVVDALNKAGLPTRWDGHPDTRILITDLDWKRRRP